jgi:uncharacterized protein (DUF1778 family)
VQFHRKIRHRHLKQKLGSGIQCVVRKFDVQLWHQFSGEFAMPTTFTNESARINLRTSAEAKAMIERAAALMGTTVSSFMLQNAFEAARRIVSETDTLLLTQRDFDGFTASIENPPKPKAALRKLMARR